MTAEAVVMPVQTLEQTSHAEYVGRHMAEEEVAQATWRSRLAQIAGRVALVVGMAAGATVAMNVEAQPAEAKQQGVCKGPFLGVSAQQTCLLGFLGSKDYANHREWLERVEVSSPDAGPGMLEIWGDGFYEKKYNATWAGWNVRRFVTSGTNVCAAGTDNRGDREIACFHIKV